MFRREWQRNEENQFRLPFLTHLKLAQHSTFDLIGHNEMRWRRSYIVQMCYAVNGIFSLSHGSQNVRALIQSIRLTRRREKRKCPSEEIDSCLYHHNRSLPPFQEGFSTSDAAATLSVSFKWEISRILIHPPCSNEKTSFLLFLFLLLLWDPCQPFLSICTTSGMSSFGDGILILVCNYLARDTRVWQKREKKLNGKVCSTRLRLNRNPLQ